MDEFTGNQDHAESCGGDDEGQPSGNVSQLATQDNEIGLNRGKDRSRDPNHKRRELLKGDGLGSKPVCKPLAVPGQERGPRR